MKIYSKLRPEGVELSYQQAVHEMGQAIIQCVEESGVWRGGCPCCDRPIVVKDGPMTASDEHFLLHDGGKP